MSKRSRKGGTKNPPAVEIPKEKITEEMTCEFCHKGETKDIVQSGKLYKLTTGKTVEYYHYFCCLFSSQGIQRGKDEEGLNGFLAEDIRKEVRRGETLICDYCGLNGATIPCHRKSCKKNYHFSCGALCVTPGEHLFVFRNNMDSFCFNHGPKQNKVSNLSSDPTCMVCLDTCGAPGPGPGKLVSPCCGRTYHRDCVQKTALQAGKAALKCPNCNDKDKFNEEMERCGVYIPHADAQWEMPENSNFYQFDDMLNMYKRCDSVLCSCPHGREFSRPGTKYEVIKCETCGQSGVHVSCGRLEATSSPKYICESCKPPDEDAEDSDEEDKIVRDKIKEHERRKEALFAEKKKVMYLIQEENKRLMKCKELEDKKIQEIKSILSDFDSSPSTSKQPISSKERILKKPPQVFILSNTQEHTQNRYALNMPRRSKPDSVPEPTCDNFESFEEVFRVSDTDSDEDCYEIKLPKIETVFCGSEAKKLNSANSGVSIEISDDEEGDVEIVLSEGNAQISEKISEK